MESVTNKETGETFGDVLKGFYPHGHPDFIPLMLSQISLHSSKNKAYAGGGDPLGNFKRVSDILSHYPNFPYATPEGLMFIYALKQLDCEAWNMCQGTEDSVEGFKGRTDDQAVYANLRQCSRATSAESKRDKADMSPK